MAFKGPFQPKLFHDSVIHVSGTAAAAPIPWPWQGFTQPRPSPL